VQHREAAWMQLGHKAVKCTCITDKQQGRAALTCSMNVQQGHAAKRITFLADIELRHKIIIFLVGLKYFCYNS
jgi:hypothetical protein